MQSDFFRGQMDSGLFYWPNHPGETQLSNHEEEEEFMMVTGVPSGRLRTKSISLYCRHCYTCGLYYKTITIVIMMIVSDATIWSVTYDRN
jgi:hypothetical protein